jgi:hypothetical protein
VRFSEAPRAPLELVREGVEVQQVLIHRIDRGTLLLALPTSEHVAHQVHFALRSLAQVYFG